jgi:adenylate kinase family enzyme
MTLARRIWVIGCPGAGKSTVAVRLAGALGVTSAHMDDLFWKPNWGETPDDELIAKVDRVTCEPAWVVDGNYTRIMQHFVDRVELFCWLDLPLHLCLRRLVSRGLHRVATRATICNGNRESLIENFASRRSLLLYAYQKHPYYRETYSAMMANHPHVRLRNPREVDAWLARFTAAASNATADAPPPRADETSR